MSLDFAQNVLVLYPMIETNTIPSLLRNFNPYQEPADSVDHLFLKMAACTGSVCAAGQDHDSSDSTNYLSESLYAQVLGNCSVIYRPVPRIRNIQVLMLMVRIERLMSLAHLLRHSTAGKPND
jgi:hypothetical protein